MAIFQEKTAQDYLRTEHLKNLVKALQTVYTNYSLIIGHLKSASGQQKLSKEESEHMIETYDSADFFYMTCLLLDLFSFLATYKFNPKKMASSSALSMPWNLNGSFLNNLLFEQLRELPSSSHTLVYYIFVSYIFKQNNKD